MHVVAFAFLIRFAFVSVGSGGQLVYPDAPAAFGMFNQSMAIPIHKGLWTFAALFMGALTCISLLLSLGFRKFLDWRGLHDVYSSTDPAIAWGSKKFITSGLIGLTLATLPAVLNEPSILTWLAVISWLAIPLVSLNIASPHTESRWISAWTNWPNWQTFLATLAITFFILAFDYSIGEVPADHWLIEVPINVSAYVFAHLFVASVLLSIFIYRIPLKNVFGEFKSRANSRFVLAWLVLDIKISCLVIWVIPPLLLAAAYMIYVVPTTIEVMHNLNQTRGTAFDLFIRTGDAVAEYWWMAAPSLWALWLLIAARFLVVYDNLGRRKIN